MPWLYLLFLLVLGAGLALLFLARRARARAGLPFRARVVYADTGAWRKQERPLFARHLGLTGRPDYLVEVNGETIPVEVKPNRPGSHAREADVMQLVAYGALVEEEMGKRPSHGLLKYRDCILKIEFTDALHARLEETLKEMRAAWGDAPVARSHAEAWRCRACGYREACDQALD